MVSRMGLCLVLGRGWANGKRKRKTWIFFSGDGESDKEGREGKTLTNVRGKEQESKVRNGA